MTFTYININATKDTLFRLPATDVAVKRHEREISILCFHLIEVDNEENVQIALKIVIELYKQCRPNCSPEGIVITYSTTYSL